MVCAQHSAAAAAAAPIAARSRVVTRALDPACTTRRQFGLAAGAAVLFSSAGCPPRSSAVTLEEATREPVPAAPLSQSERALIDVFERCNNSIVNIIDVTLQGRAAPQQAVEVAEGNGTGCIWDQEGHVVTNYHVLASVLNGLGPNARARGRVKVATVTVLGTDGISQAFDAYLTGYDKSKDLAVVQIDAPRSLLRPVELGDSGAVRVGQQVLALGNPYGFDHTLTTGIVSGLNRDIVSAGTTIGGGIQVDAAINPGNSGGALLDRAGRMVGVNTAIFSNTGTSVGIGFAIPIDQVKRVVPQLIEFGTVQRPVVGIQAAPEGTFVALGGKAGSGVMVQAVQGGSPADKAGIRGIARGLGGVTAGDVLQGITCAAGTFPIKNEAALNRAVDSLAKGERVEVSLLRDGKPMTVAVQL
ncbi:unnamed protein product [Pedinophyceae sp. YPF-701]|nr:unnamed protein product [Pedinophyceae sp. YPF-701]